MNKLIIIFVVLLSAFAAVAQDFFKVYPDAGEKLPAELIYPRGRKLLYSGFAPRLNRIPELRDAGFTCMGPAYGNQESFIEACRKAGVQRFQRIIPEGLTKEKLDDKEAVDWEKISAEIKAQVLAHRDDPGVAIWYLMPEELRYWRKNEYRYLQTAYKIIKENDPLKRPVWEYLPGHYSKATLVKYPNYMDYLGKGMYTNYSNQQKSRVWCRWSTELEVAAVQEAKSSALPLAVPEMFRQPPEEALPLVPAWVRHDVYCSLIAGAKGVVIFSLSQRANFSAWEAYYTNYLKVAGELRKLGEIFLFGTRCNDIRITYRSGSEKTSCTIRSGKEKVPQEMPSVSWADISYHGRRYLFAVNSANEAVTVQFSGMPENGVTLLDALTGQVMAETLKNGVFETKIATLEVKLYEITREKK